MEVCCNCQSSRLIQESTALYISCDAWQREAEPAALVQVSKDPAGSVLPPHICVAISSDAAAAALPDAQTMLLQLHCPSGRNGHPGELATLDLSSSGAMLQCGSSECQLAACADT